MVGTRSRMASRRAFSSHGVKHQPRLLFQGHLGEEIRDPFLDRPAAIFVGVQPAVLIQVAEGETGFAKVRASGPNSDRFVVM